MPPRKRILKNIGSYKADGLADLMSVAPYISKEVKTAYPKGMEDLDCNYGYMLYRSKIKNYNHSEKLKVIDASDRCHIYIDEKLVATQYKEEIVVKMKL